MCNYFLQCNWLYCVTQCNVSSSLKVFTSHGYIAKAQIEGTPSFQLQLLSNMPACYQSCSAPARNSCQLISSGESSYIREVYGSILSEGASTKLVPVAFLLSIERSQFCLRLRLKSSHAKLSLLTMCALRGDAHATTQLCTFKENITTPTLISITTSQMAY